MEDTTVLYVLEHGDALLFPTGPIHPTWLLNRLSIMERHRRHATRAYDDTTTAQRFIRSKKRPRRIPSGLPDVHLNGKVLVTRDGSAG